MYNGVGSRASDEASAANGFHNATPYETFDPSTFHPPCPIDNSSCNVIGGQAFNLRCTAQGHQWTFSNGSLVSNPYVFDSKVSVDIPVNRPTTLG